MESKTERITSSEGNTAILSKRKLRFIYAVGEQNEIR